MDRAYWQRQASDKPLFPDLLWSRPENRTAAGKLLVIGGNLHGFAAPAEAYGESLKAGIGMVRALLPDAIKKYVGILMAETDYAPSTPSGSFSQKALAVWLDSGLWADGVLLAGDMGRNSETAIVLERYLQRTQQIVVLTRDAADYAIAAPGSILDRPNSVLVISLSQLQRLATRSRFDMPVTFSMDLLHLVDWLYAFTSQHAINLVVRHLDTILVAVNGQVSTTPAANQKPIWRLKTATHAAVWWLQNPGKPFEALTTAVYTVIQEPH